MYHYIVTTKDTTRGLIFTEELKVLNEKSVAELEAIFNLNKEFTADDFMEYYEICQEIENTGEVITLKHFDTNFKMKC